MLGDLGDAAAVDAAVAGVRVVYHAGAAMRGPWEEHARGTVAGTHHVVDSVLRHRVARLVHVSSLSVLDWTALDGALVTEEAPLEPRPEARGSYTRAKLLAEQHVLAAVRDLGAPRRDRPPRRSSSVRTEPGSTRSTPSWWGGTSCSSATPTPPRR